MNRVARPPAPPPGLSPLLLAVLVLTILVGLPVDRHFGISGQLAVSLWTWGVFLVLLVRVNPQLRTSLMLCLVISTVGELCLSLWWGVYGYWLHNVPFFVPPGHVMLFTLGLTFAPRTPRWLVPVTALAAAAYGTWAFAVSVDTISVPLAVLFLACMAFGSNRRLYAMMFIVSLVMELYGTWIGNWVWAPAIPGLPFTSANPPLCVGALYCLLDLGVVNVDRLRRRLRRAAPIAMEAGSAA